MRLSEPADQEGQHITIGLDVTRFPFMFRKFDIVISMAEIILILEDASLGETITVSATPSGKSARLVDLKASPGIGGQLSGKLESISAGTGEWQMDIDEAFIPAVLKVPV